MMDKNSKLFAVQNKLERTRHFLGGYWTFLATGEETGGQFSLIEMNIRKGLEAPGHTHTHEDESFFILDGEIRVLVNGEEHHLKAGEFIHLPKGIAHAYFAKTDTVKMLCTMAPAGLENMFLAMSRPADKMEYPELPSGPPSPELLKRIGELQAQYGIIGMQTQQLREV
jgi:quercetin dioxygenase-like cupin family protein